MPDRGPQLKSPPSEEGTDPNIQISAKYVKHKASESAWKAGWATGIGSAVFITTVAFGIWFKSEASAQEKADKAQADAIAAADAGADKKLAPIATDLAVVKVKVDRLTEDVAEMKKNTEAQNAEIIRLLKRRDGR